MRISGNNISIRRCESFTIDKVFVNKDDSPYIVSSAIENPYILISIVSNNYKTPNSYTYNKWCDLSNFTRFYSTVVYTLHGTTPSLPSTADIGDYIVSTVIDLDGTVVYYCANCVFALDDGTYCYFRFTGNPEVDGYAGSFVEYKFRIVANFDTSVTRTWSSQSYKYSITLVGGKTTHSVLEELYGENVGYNNIITGTVTEDGNVVPDASVEVYKGSDNTGNNLGTVKTNSDGVYVFKFYESGYYTLGTSGVYQTVYVKYDTTQDQNVVNDFNISNSVPCDNELLVAALPSLSNTVKLSPAFAVYSINWGDGVITSASDFDYSASDFYYTEHSYSSAGFYTISIYGSLYRDLSNVYTFNVMGGYDYKQSLSMGWPSQNLTLLSAKVSGLYFDYKVFPDYSEVLAGFPGCVNLSAISLANCLGIDDSIFADCSRLLSVYAPSVTYVGMAFYNCTYLQSISLPNCTTLEATFSNCYSLKTVSLPKASDVGDGVFHNCSSLTYVELPSCVRIGQAFIGCANLSIVSLPICNYIMGHSVFSGCYELSTLYLGRGSMVVDIADVASVLFADTLITSSTGYVYVPSNLVEAYKSDIMWEDFSNVITGV